MWVGEWVGVWSGWLKARRPSVEGTKECDVRQRGFSLEQRG
jgi:hypothetical protein